MDRGMVSEKNIALQLLLRCVARPERRVAELLVRLGLNLPTRSRIVEDLPAAALENVVQKNDA